MAIQDPPVIEPAVTNNPNHDDLREKSEKWIEENPKAFSMLKEFALHMASRERPFGMKLLIERARWEWMVTTKGDLKFNNNYTAYVARAIVQAHPEIGEFLRFRKTVW